MESEKCFDVRPLLSTFLDLSFLKSRTPLDESLSASSGHDKFTMRAKNQKNSGLS